MWWFNKVKSKEKLLKQRAKNIAKRSEARLEREKQERLQATEYKEAVISSIHIDVIEAFTDGWLSFSASYPIVNANYDVLDIQNLVNERLEEVDIVVQVSKIEHDKNSNPDFLNYYLYVSADFIKNEEE